MLLGITTDLLHCAPIEIDSSKHVQTRIQEFLKEGFDLVAVIFIALLIFSFLMELLNHAYWKRGDFNVLTPSGYPGLTFVCVQAQLKQCKLAHSPLARYERASRLLDSTRPTRLHAVPRFSYSLT